MKIRRIFSQYRRDLSVEYECQFCKYRFKDAGHDDAHFHEVVIPQMECPRCGKSVEKNRDELKEEYRPLKPKYPEEFKNE